MMGRSKSTDKVRRAMAMVHPNAAAIDIGATMHVAAVRADRTPEPVRSFGTFTKDLHRLVDWFAECGVDTVVMELTSVYWIPIFELLDARGFAVFLVNARDAKRVPGRKTDVSDAEWLQRLHSYGLLRAKLSAQRPDRGVACHLRQRERLLEYGASDRQHRQKALPKSTFSSTTSSRISPARPGCGSSEQSSPASAIPWCWRACAICGATPLSRRSRSPDWHLPRRAPVRAPSRHLPSTTRTRRRHLPVTPGSKPC